MAKKNNEEPAYVDASLVKLRKEFKNLLEIQISKGDELLNKQVPINSSSPSSFYGKKTVYDENIKNAFIAEYNQWHDYNVEIYKTSFSSTNSTYRRDYESHVWTYYGGDIIKHYKDTISRLINQMKSDINKIELIPCSVSEVLSSEKDEKSALDKTSVFIVHGHDDAAILEVKIFLTKLKLTPVILREQPNGGQTIIEKIETYTNVGFAIVLYTPCDEGKSKESDKCNPRARQNVVFEHGYLCAKIGRNNVCALVKDGVEKPGDLDGVVYTPMDLDWKSSVFKELKNAGYNVDANNLF